MADFLSKIRKVFGSPSNAIISNLSDPKISINSSLTLDATELKKHYQDIYVSDKKDSTTKSASILSYIEPIKDALMKSKIDNSKLYQIAPEIENATTILIPSILSPNNLSTIKGLNFMINNEDIRPSVKSDIIKILNAHFNDNLKLYEKLDKWIKAALINDGAKPLLILPPQVLKGIKEESLETSTESLSSFIDKLNNNGNMHNIFQQNTISYSIESLSDIKNEIGSTNKDLFNTALEELNDALATIEAKPIEKQQLISHLYKSRENFISLEGLSQAFKQLKEDGALIISNRIDMIGANKILANKGINKIEDEFNDFMSGTPSKAKYKNTPFTDLSFHLMSPNEATDDYPMLEELPYESVIPIYTKNTPENHIGYFILLDSEGCPIKADINRDDLNKFGTPEVDRLFRTMKTDNSMNRIFSSPRLGNTNYKAKIKKSVVNKVINSFIDITLKKALNNADINSVDINLNNDIMNMMFSRLLKQQKTILLFAPKSIIFYLAFMYNENGTGKSKIENIKFPLSLKMTFMITKLIGLIDASINRKQIEVELDEENSINHLEILRAIKNRLIQNRLSGFSYDPSKIIQSIAEKEISVIPKNLPGVNNFSINEEEKTRAYPKPDDSLFEEINNMYILGLDVPPSSLNQLGENEFSRSIATYNFFFSNKIVNYQTIIVNCISNMIITYVKYSKSLKDQIAEVLKNNIDPNEIDDKDNTDKKQDEKSKEEITKENDNENTDESNNNKELLNTVISNIRITLPSPKIVYDKAQYDEIDKYIEIIDKITDELFPDELIGDRDYDDTYKMIKSFAKVTLLRQYLSDLNINTEFEIDDLENIDIETLASTKQIVMNIDKLLKDFKTKLAPEEEGSSGY